MTEFLFIQQFLKDNIRDYDLIVESKPSMSGSAVLYRASIDKVQGGNLCTSGYEYSLEDAFTELVKELRDEVRNLEQERLQEQLKNLGKKK